MIIDQESVVGKTQPVDLEYGVPAATSRTPLIPPENPPAYTPREDSGPSSSPAPPYRSSSSQPTSQKQPPSRAAKRFFNSLLLALFLYAAIALSLKFLFFAVRTGRPPHGPHRGHPRFEDGNIINCITDRDIPWQPSSRVPLEPFRIPLDSRVISVFARGQQGTGSVRVEPHQTNVNEITVHVAAQFKDWDTLAGTEICLLEKEKGELGVGIFTPDHPTWSSKKTQFEIIVKIPHQLPSPVLELPRLDILTPDFQVTLPDVDEFVRFHDLTIHTSKKPVAIGSVRAANIDIRTSGADIHGTFLANSSLSLTTSDAQITANILLENDPASRKKTSVHATTTNGSLTGVISLLSNRETPRYTVRADTTNAVLNLSLLQRSDSSHPPPSPILDVVGTTTNGPAELLLPSSFEGSFGVSTSFASRADFSPGSGSKGDPLGLGRKQKIELMPGNKSRKEGLVYWGDLGDGRELGRIQLSTSNAPASLRLH